MDGGGCVDMSIAAPPVARFKARNEKVAILRTSHSSLTANIKWSGLRVSFVEYDHGSSGNGQIRGRHGQKSQANEEASLVLLAFHNVALQVVSRGA